MGDRHVIRRKDPLQLNVHTTFPLAPDIARERFFEFAVRFRDHLTIHPLPQISQTSARFSLENANKVTEFLTSMFSTLPSRLSSLERSINTIAYENHAGATAEEVDRPKEYREFVQTFEVIRQSIAGGTANAYSGIVRNIGLVQLRTEFVRFCKELEQSKDGELTIFLSGHREWQQTSASKTYKQRGTAVIRKLTCVSVDEWDGLIHNSVVPYYLADKFGLGAVLLLPHKLKGCGWHKFGSREAVEEVIAAFKDHDEQNGGNVEYICAQLLDNIVRPLQDNPVAKMQVRRRAPGVMAANEPLTELVGWYKLVLHDEDTDVIESAATYAPHRHRAGGRGDGRDGGHGAAGSDAEVMDADDGPEQQDVRELLRGDRRRVR